MKWRLFPACRTAISLRGRRSGRWQRGRLRRVDVSSEIRPLAGVRVLELGNYIAAPTAGRILGEFGAEVIKVERPGTGDELRNWRLYGGSTSICIAPSTGTRSRSCWTCARTRARRRARPGAALRRPAGELPAGHPGEVGPRARGARRGEPGPCHHPDLRVRPDRAAGAAARVRGGRGGGRRLARVGGRPRPAARAGRGVDRRIRLRGSTPRSAQ